MFNVSLNCEENLKADSIMEETLWPWKSQTQKVLVNYRTHIGLPWGNQPSQEVTFSIKSYKTYDKINSHKKN